MPTPSPNIPIDLLWIMFCSAMTLFCGLAWWLFKKITAKLDSLDTLSNTHTTNIAVVITRMDNLDKVIDLIKANLSDNTRGTVEIIARLHNIQEFLTATDTMHNRHNPSRQ
jgi:hypothetical protein